MNYDPEVKVEINPLLPEVGFGQGFLTATKSKLEHEAKADQPALKT